MRITMLAFPDMTQLDLTGPHEVLAQVPGATVTVVARERAPVAARGGLRIVPDATLADAPAADLLFVPGGPGTGALLEDVPVLEFLRAQAAQARWITSVCTGALVLGAAGLLVGRRATTHWLSMPLLTEFGATPVAQRVVVDGDRITGGGVTAGIDFGLAVAAQIAGEDTARRIQLLLEYDPAPPFDAGHPDRAPAAVVDGVRSAMAPLQASRRDAARRAAQRFC
jgi:cyclohexyl-isocyanide hydratase